jgi:hypothetical protein
VLSIKGNLIVLLKLALNCKLWTESHLPSLKGNKAIDNRVYTRGTERSRYVINTRPKPQLTVDPGVFILVKAPSNKWHATICRMGRLLK